MAFPGDVNSLGSVSGSQTLAAAGHATRHNEVKTALEGLRDVLGGTAVPSGTVQPILAAGSASAPSLSFMGDSNTGLWSPAADTVAASTGGTERMRVDNAGNVGIGKTPAGAVLDVLGNVKSSTSVDATTYVRGGHVAVGTSGATTAFGAGAISTDSNWGMYYRANTGENVASHAFVNAGGTELMRIDLAGLITGTGTSLGAWTAYTPTLGGTGWALGDGTAAGVYCQIGKIVHFKVLVTFGSTSTFGATTGPTISYPVNNVTTNSNFGFFNCIAFDTSASAQYPLYVRNSSATVCFIRSWASPLGNVNSAAPFTWGSGDIIALSGTYEAA